MKRRGSAPGERRGGRKKGTPNRLTASLKEAIQNAFAEVGGQAYLVRIAQEQPQVFCTLLGKIIPADTNVNLQGALAVSQPVDRPIKETREEWLARRNLEMLQGPVAGTAE